MEDLIISAKEHKLLKKFQKQLEERYKVKICMPKTSSLDSDVVFVSLHGENKNRDCVKKFLSEKMNQRSELTECKENVELITLSDSEEESSSSIDDSVCTIESLKQDFQNFDDSILVIESTNEIPQVKSAIPLENKHSASLDDSVCIIESTSRRNWYKNDITGLTKHVLGEKTENRGQKRKKTNSKKKKKIKSKKVSSTSDAITSETCEVTSTTEDVDVMKDHMGESVCVKEAVTNTKNSNDFIPIENHNKSPLHVETINNLCDESQPQNEIIVMEPDPPRSLRPIVIDGNNVAIEHGRVSHSFSSKGIKLAIQYFLDRGHTQVTAFVPKFRRNFNPHRTFPTKDASILDELAEKQLVVFTPSRRLNGKNIASYDDRFIVQLAATNGGVIVSNDNYRDLVDENESFKEAIEQRLLMFCFVGDMFMVPEDPLGRDGPKLNDYLSFPAENKKSQ